MREHGGRIPDGVLRTVVPAAPDAWIIALRRHGTMRFADVAAPATAPGSVEAIVTDLASGMMGAGTDPRRPAYAIAI